jgi:hypothetical protein
MSLVTPVVELIREQKREALALLAKSKDLNLFYMQNKFKFEKQLIDLHHEQEFMSGQLQLEEEKGLALLNLEQQLVTQLLSIEAQIKEQEMMLEMGEINDEENSTVILNQSGMYANTPRQHKLVY